MPVRVLDAPSRHDLVAYLQKTSEELNKRAGPNAPASGGEYQSGMPTGRNGS
jgi:hypothetical protein